MLNPPVNCKIQELFKVYECFSSTFQGKFNFQGRFKTVLYIQVLFKPVQTLETKRIDNLPLLFDLKGSGNFAGFKIGHIAPDCKPDSEMEVCITN